MARRSRGYCAVSLGGVAFGWLLFPRRNSKATKSGGMFTSISHIRDQFWTFYLENMDDIWSNYSDLTRPHPKGTVAKEGKSPLFEGNPGWWKLARWIVMVLVWAEVLPDLWGSRWRLCRWDYEDWGTSRDLKLRRISRKPCFAVFFFLWGGEGPEKTNKRTSKTTVYRAIWRKG